MSIATEISRLQADRNTIRAKLVELGMANNTDNLDVLAAAIDALVNRGAVSVSVKEGETYTIPAGYHNGAGTVSGVTGGGSYSLQSKTITPTKRQQSVTSDEGYFGLSDVVVAAIPDAYQDVTSVTAAAGEVLTGKIFVASDGTVVTGTMTNNGAVSKTLDGTTVTYTIPKGYHDGTGKVTITLEEKTVTPTKSAQTITPTSGKVLSKVTVEPIPTEYQDVSGVTAGAADVLPGKVFVNAAGEEVEGSMPTARLMPDCDFDADTGVITHRYTVTTGYIEGKEKEESAELPTQAAKTVTPTKQAQTVVEKGKWTTGEVKVAAIPAAYQDVTGVTATAAQVLAGEKIVDANGAVVEGTMANNADVSESMDGLTKTSVTVPAGYTTGGTISLTGDIEEALAGI